MEGQAGVDGIAHLLRQLADGEITGIAEVDRAGVIAVHQLDHALHQIIDVAEGTGLGAIAIDGKGFSAQGLNDEVAHHPAIVGEHAGPVGVEDAGDADLNAMDPMEIEAEGFSDALALDVAGADAVGVGRTSVALRLGVHLGIAADLTGGGEQQARADAAGEAEHVGGAQEAGLGGLDGVVLTVHEGGGAGQVPDAVDLKANRFGDVVADQLKVGMADPAADVVHAAGEVVVEANHLLSCMHETIHQVGADEDGAAGDKVAHQ